MKSVSLRLFFTAIVVFLLTFLSGCSHARGMAQEDGTVRVVMRGSTSARAQEAAIDEAKDYCEERDMSPIYVKESGPKYTGKMDEETRDTIQKASTAAWMIGGMNSPIHDAGTVGHVYASGNDYEAEVIFRCK